MNGAEADLGFLSRDLISCNSTTDSTVINCSTGPTRESRFELGVKIPVIVNLVDPDLTIWVSTVEGQGDLDKLMAELDTKYSKGEMVPLKNPKVGSLCVARYLN